MTHLCVRHTSFIRATRLIHARATPSCMHHSLFKYTRPTHDSFARKTRLIQTCNRIHLQVRATGPFHVRNTTHSHARHDTFTCAPTVPITRHKNHFFAINRNGRARHERIPDNLARTLLKRDHVCQHHGPFIRHGQNQFAIPRKLQTHQPARQDKIARLLPTPRVPYRDFPAKSVARARGNFAAVGRVRHALNRAVAFEIHETRVAQLRLVQEFEPRRVC